MKYPIIIVHGILCSEDSWSGVAAVMRQAGAIVYIAKQYAVASIKTNALLLTREIKQILMETNSKKVCLIAHSMGGLVSRYAISRLGAEKYVNSLITVNTPHRGCGFIDLLLKIIPRKFQQRIFDYADKRIESKYKAPSDFALMTKQLSVRRCSAFNALIPDSSRVLYLSAATYFIGKSDGIVKTSSAVWGSYFLLLNNKWKRRVEHDGLVLKNTETIKSLLCKKQYIRKILGLAMITA